MSERAQTLHVKLTDEQREILQSLIDEAYNQFVRIVAKGRNMSESRVREIADGRVYSASQAKELGLIDGVCNEEDFLNCENIQRDEGCFL